MEERKDFVAMLHVLLPLYKPSLAQTMSTIRIRTTKTCQDDGHT